MANIKKQTKNFSFNFPLIKKVVDLSRPRGERFDKVGELSISGKGYFFPSMSRMEPSERFDFDIEEINFNGMNIINVLEYFTELDEINEACSQHVAELFEEEADIVYHGENDGLFEQIAGVVKAHTKSLYGIDLDNPSKPEAI